MLLQLLQNDILLLQLTEPHQENLQVFLDLLGSLRLDLISNGLYIPEMMLPDPLDECLILFDVPVKESGLSKISEALLVVLGYDLEVVLGMLDLSTECLELLKVVKELELIEFGNLDGPVLLRLVLFLLLSLLGLGLSIVILDHRLIEVVVKHGGLSALPPRDQIPARLLSSIVLLLLLILDDGLDLLPLLTVVLILEEKHVGGFDLEVEGVGKLLRMLRGLFFQKSELALSFFNDGVNILEAIVAQDLLLLL